MPTITPALIPTKAVGNLFSSLAGGDTSLNIRWLEPTDPVFYEALNRPIADIAIRQLVIAKAVDALQAQIGHMTLFPFVVQPIIGVGVSFEDLPPGFIWDMQASLPAKWQYVRLAKIIRISGTNSTETSTYTGYYRLVFSAITDSDETETYVFYADYQINSPLLFQPTRIVVCTENVATPAVNTSEALTISGWITFRTLVQSDEVAQSFYEALAPPTNTTTDGGLYVSPAVYEIVDTISGGTNVTDDFSLSEQSHGHGFLTEAAWTAIPAVGSDFQSWLQSSNYPFSNDASLISADDFDKEEDETTIPKGLFKEFNILVPAGDGPMTNSSSGYFYTYIDKIERVSLGNVSTLKFHIITKDMYNERYSEVASFDLQRSYEKDQVIPIIPDVIDTATSNEVGRGHVVLSDLWTASNAVLTRFYGKFVSESGGLDSMTFTRTSSRISSFAISRMSKYSSNKGQYDALSGTTSTFTTPILPSSANRYVTELDQGLGNAVNFSNNSSVLGHIAIEPIGYSGALNHRIVKLVVDSTLVPNDPLYYQTYILPRLTLLFGNRPPQFGDGWYNGVRFMWYNGDSWQG